VNFHLSASISLCKTGMQSLQSLPLNPRIIRSKEVLEYIIPRLKTGEFKAVRGNHEDIMYDGLFHPIQSIWSRNGSNATIKSYNDDYDLMEVHAKVLSKLPLYLIFNETDKQGRKLIVSHAFCTDFIDDYLKIQTPEAMSEYDKKYGIQARCDIMESADLFNWNRVVPHKHSNFFNITGHNITGLLMKKYIHIDGYDPKTEVIIDEDLGYACIDTGAFIDESYSDDFGGMLTAIRFPDLEITQQKNID